MILGLASLMARLLRFRVGSEIAVEKTEMHAILVIINS